MSSSKCAVEQTYPPYMLTYSHIVILRRDDSHQSFYEEVLVYTAVSIHRSTDTAAASHPENEKSLYERFGGVFAIATLVDHFSSAVLDRWTAGS